MKMLSSSICLLRMLGNKHKLELIILWCIDQPGELFMSLNNEKQLYGK